MKRGFTLIELLVVVAILGVLAAALVTAFGNAPEQAEIGKCQTLVKNVETALTALYNQTGAWPDALIDNNNTSKGLDAKAGYLLAKKNFYTARYDSDKHELSGLDKFGVVTPWAAQVIKERGASCSEGTAVPIGGTIADHRFRYALDLDGDGKIEGVNVAGALPGAKTSQGTVNVRATVAVWCLGPKGKVITSWVEGQTVNVK